MVSTVHLQLFFVWVHHAINTIFSLFQFLCGDIWFCRDFWFGRACTRGSLRLESSSFSWCQASRLDASMTVSSFLCLTLQTHMEVCHSTWTVQVSAWFSLFIHHSLVWVHHATSTFISFFSVSFVGDFWCGRTYTSVADRDWNLRAFHGVRLLSCLFVRMIVIAFLCPTLVRSMASPVHLRPFGVHHGRERPVQLSHFSNDIWLCHDFGLVEHAHTWQAEWFCQRPPCLPLSCVRRSRRTWKVGPSTWTVLLLCGLLSGFTTGRERPIHIFPNPSQ